MMDTSTNLDELVGMLCTAVRRMLKLKGGVDVSPDPVVLEKEIVSFNQRMRVDGLEKFNARTVFAVVKFYVDVDALDQDKPIGALIVYVEADDLGRLLWKLDYPRIDEDDEEVLLDGCGTLTNLIAGYFVKEIADMGHVHLEMSHFESFINSAVNGVAFASQQTKKYEVGFYLAGKKRIVAELTMGPVPRVY
jgi:hypothetical protein